MNPFGGMLGERLVALPMCQLVPVLFLLDLLEVAYGE